MSTIVVGGFKLNEDYVPELANKTSLEYKDKADHVLYEVRYNGTTVLCVPNVMLITGVWLFY